MSKININDITTQYGFKDAINARLQQIEDEFNNKVFYRNNPTGEPNSLNNDLDMGNNDILNINKITVNDIGVIGESSFKELIEEAKQAVVDCTEQTTLSTLQANASAYSASQSSTSASSAATSASEAQAAALLVDPRMDAVEAEVATQTTSINTFKNDVSNLFGAMIGSIQSIFCSDSYVPLGMVPTNGAEYTRSQFPDLYDNFLVGGKLLTTTYAAFTTQIGLTGNCAKFAIDTTAKTFKVPLIKDGDSITQAASAAELGKSVKAGLPDAKGSTSSDVSAAGGVMVGGSYRGTGVYSGSSMTRVYWGCPAGSSQGVSGLDFALSNYDPIYGNSNTVTDEQVRLRHFVVLASAQNDASVFDWSNYMTALAGKANTDLSNATGNAIGFYFYARDEKTSGTGGGTTSASSWTTRDINTVVYNGISGASLTSNRITLPTGKYRIAARTPTYCGEFIRAALYDVTHATYLAYGSSVYCYTQYGAQRDSFVTAVCTLPVATTLELRMYSSVTQNDGLGRATSISGVKEVYSEIEIWKM